MHNKAARAKYWHAETIGILMNPGIQAG